MAWHSLAGALGATFIVGSYFFLQLEKLNAKSLAYCLSNFLGAGLILISLCFDFNLSAAVVESFWLLTSAYGVLKNYLRPSRVFH